jgi:hypothetical protein
MQARDNSDGLLSREKRLTSDMDELIKARQARLGYIIAKHPEVAETLAEYEQLEVAASVKDKKIV